MKRNDIRTIILLDVVLFLLIFTLSGRPLLLLAFCLLTSIFLIKNKNDWRVYLTTIVVALFIESISVHLHIWQYSHTDFFSVPLWIFLMWGVLALTFYKIILNSIK
jgi:uncharacterized membrane protein YjjP (DUF1212 family)